MKVLRPGLVVAQVRVTLEPTTIMVSAGFAVSVGVLGVGYRTVKKRQGMAYIKRKLMLNDTRMYIYLDHGIRA